MKYLLIALLALLPALASASHGPSAPRPWVQMRAGPAGHVLTWEVSADADGWRIETPHGVAFQARYIDPGELVETPLSPAQWTPGEWLQICTTWRLSTHAITSCHTYERPFVVWVGVVHR
jgi:hypothetical protein